jgi:hypothetical protein
MLARVLYPANIPTWVTPGAPDSHRLSLAGWWRTLVSQPLFVSLQAAALWRLLLWGRLLWRVSRMDLQLVASHPDRLGGLRLVQVTLRGFLLLAFAWGVIDASNVAAGVIFDDRTIMDYRHLILAHVLGVLVLFIGPQLTLWAPVLRLHWQGTLEYGRLASQLGREFDAKWLTTRRVDKESLSVPDFSATTDLYSIAANVRDINVFFLDTRSVLALVVATLLPFVPILFVRFPVDEVLNMALKALV